MGNPVYGYVTEKIIKLIEENKTLPWHRPWKVSGIQPTNLATKTPYHGINCFLLAYSQYGSPYWASLKQVHSLGGRVKTEEMSNTTMVVYWQISKYRIVNGRRTYLKAGDNGKYDGKSFLLRYYRIYNLEQTEGIPESKIPATEPVAPFVPVEKCESIMASYINANAPLKLVHGGDKASYSPMFDTIRMPKKEHFDIPEMYYSILFHEGVHSTGAENRMKRDLSGLKGDHLYSKEELVAEMGAAMLASECGIENEITQGISAEYIRGYWVESLKKDPSMIVSAASKAERAVKYILGETIQNYDEEEKSE